MDPLRSSSCSVFAGFVVNCNEFTKIKWVKRYTCLSALSLSLSLSLKPSFVPPLLLS
jgi:hypothetical protein